MKSKKVKQDEAAERARLRTDGDPTYLEELAAREAQFPGRK